MTCRFGETRRQWLKRCVGAAGTAAIAGCLGDETDGETEPEASPVDDRSDDGGDDWPMYGVDRRNTSYQPDAVGPDGDELTSRVLYDHGGVTTNPVAVVDDVVFGTGGVSYALDLETEELRWEWERLGAPTVYDGTVFGPANGGRLYACDAETGEEWESEKIDAGHFASFYTEPIPTGDGVLIVTEESLWRVDPDSGDYEHLLEIPDNPGTADWPAFHDDTLYLPRGGVLFAVDVGAAEIEWTFEPEREGRMRDSNPAVVDGTVYVTSEDDELHAIDAATGTERWSAPVDTRSSMVEVSPAVAHGNVYFSDRERVVALDAETGTTEWEAENETIVASYDVVVAGSDCYVATTEGIWVYDAHGGELEWEHGVADSSLMAPPAVYDGRVFVPTRDVTLYAIEDA